jgi:hypothetical protein
MRPSRAAAAGRPPLTAILCVATVIVAAAWAVDSAEAAPVFANTSVQMYLKQNTFPSDLEEEKIFLNAGTGTTVSGQVGAQDGVPTVYFTSQTALDAANGFATIKGENDVPFYDLSIEVPDYTFTDLIFNVSLFDADTNSLRVEAFSVDEFDNEISLGFYAGFTGESAWVPGENEILVLAIDDAFLTRILLTSPSGFISIDGFDPVEDEGFDQTKQFEISGLEAVNDQELSSVPLPPALPLFATGLAALGFMHWRRRRRKSAAVSTCARHGSG